MVKRILLTLLLLLVLVSLPLSSHAQVNPQQGHGAPSGVCLGPYVDVDAGNFYVCKVGQYALAGGSSSSSPTSSLVQSGLLADYLLIDGSGTTIKDSSANNNTGTFGGGANAPTWGASPQFGLTFSGNQFVSLPSSLNAARTVFFYFDDTTNSGQFNSLLTGNGGGAIGNSLMIPTNYNFGVNVGTNIGTIAPAPVGGGLTQGFVNVGGVGVVAVTFSAVDHIFVNGVEEPNYNTTATSAGQMTLGNFQLGGTAAGTGFGASTYCTCKIYRVVFYNRVLTAGEILANSTLVNAQMNARGLVGGFLGPSTLTTDQVITVGDSQTSGTGVTTPWPSIMVLTNGTWSVYNAGSAGRTIVGFSKGEVQENFPLLHANPARNMEITLAGTNDIAVSGLTGAQTAQAAETFNLTLQSQRVPTAMATMLSRTGADAGKNSYNAPLRQYWPVFANSLCDFSAVPSLGADGASASSIFFIGDGIHPNQNAHTNIMAPVGQGCLNHIHGNRDQSTATVYAAAAAVAVATTVGSEATNTVTLTTAATPANCNVGNLVFVTGVTPAGYNTTVGNGFGLGGANILTRSATQITYYNQTTGLGAVSVQGTIVCPQQQDNDIYQVANFGAGNYTLQSCQLWMGQPISIKNINAVASTVVPWLGMPEQIDGAANLTLAAGATAVLWPRLVSAAAGGCNWFREQNN